MELALCLLGVEHGLGNGNKKKQKNHRKTTTKTRIALPFHTSNLRNAVLVEFMLQIQNMDCYLVLSSIGRPIQIS